MSSPADTCRGRFAPTPSGPLHFGSIIAALGSYLQTRSQHGLWFVRIEDIDVPRVDPDATSSILGCLEDFGLVWDGEVMYQQQRQSRYDEVIDWLRSNDLAYPCACSRKSLPPGPYPGNCRDGLPQGKHGRSLRLRTKDLVINFDDQIQGRQSNNVHADTGDFVIHRGDDITAYHLCVVVDDHDMGITEIVRGMDLLPCTPAQIYLQRTLDYSQPVYCHLPVAINNQGTKLSKQTMAPAVNPERGSEVLLNALRFLGQSPDPALSDANVHDILDWAVQHWCVGNVPDQTEIQVDV